MDCKVIMAIKQYVRSFDSLPWEEEITSEIHSIGKKRRCFLSRLNEYLMKIDDGPNENTV